MLARQQLNLPWMATTSWHSCRSSRNIGLKLEAIAKALHESFLNGNPRRRQGGRRPSIKSWEGRSLSKTGIGCKHRLLSRSIGHWLLCESQVAGHVYPWEFLSFRDLPRRAQCIDNESAPVSSRTSVREWLEAGQAVRFLQRETALAMAS